MRNLKPTPTEQKWISRNMAALRRHSPPEAVYMLAVLTGEVMQRIEANPPRMNLREYIGFLATAVLDDLPPEEERWPSPTWSTLAPRFRGLDSGE